MNTGMLWYDNDPKTSLDLKIDRATDYYKRKYGLTPDLCLVHPSMLAAAQSGTLTGKQGSRLAVRANRIILPGHLWIGSEK